MERYYLSRIPVSPCICTLLFLLCLVVSPGCRQKAEEPAPPEQTQQSEAPTDTSNSSTDIGQAVVPSESVETAAPAEDEPPVVVVPEEAVEFELEEVSVFDLPDGVRRSFVRGLRVVLKEEPDEEVKVYPGFESDKPLYGSVAFGAELGKPGSGIRHPFAIDESRGTESGYDRLFIDENLDGDLTNDPPRKPASNLPDSARLQYSSIKEQVCFKGISVRIDPGDDPQRRLEVMPRLLISNSEYRTMYFVTTKAHRGRIRLGKQRFDAFLGHSYRISGWFDNPWTALHLLPTDDSGRSMSSWWGAEMLMAIHRIGDTHYRLSATPEGDKLFVWTYDGPFGTFEIDAGGRDIEDMSAQGGLQAEKMAVSISYELGKDERPGNAHSFRLPVGDYLPSYMTVKYGDLQISMSQSYHSDGKPRDTENRTWVYGIKIREDKPFVFDFSNDPAVVFASPARDHRVKRGEELTVAAVLTDPVLDIMLRRLHDTSGSGSNSLDPKVTITRADGEVVDEGTMPFG